MAIEELIERLEDIAGRYGLKILYLDYSDITLISRVGFSPDVFIQIYANIKKEKTNMALIVGGQRIYGIDKEGGFYHEHPLEKPYLHVETEQIGIEDFVIKSIDLLKRISLI